MADQGFWGPRLGRVMGPYPGSSSPIVLYPTGGWALPPRRKVEIE